MSSDETIYLDSAATTPVDKSVLEEMLPFLSSSFGNPSSVHTLGRQARHAIEQARGRIADVLDVEEGEIIFTGSGTEANNLALSTLHQNHMPSRLLTSPTEHEAILGPAEALSRRGITVSMIKPEPNGSVTPEMVRSQVDDRPVVVSLMTVNNEIGVLNNIPAIAEVVHAGGGFMHTDCVQAGAFYNLSDLCSASDMLTLSAHKIGGPKGVGLLFVRTGISLSGTQKGGQQERGRRAGTENVAGIVGFARALELARQRRESSSTAVRQLRILLEKLVLERLGTVTRVLTPKREDISAPHILHMIFSDQHGVGLDGEMLVLGMDLANLQVSTGSACSSGAVKPSHVLTALDIPREIARGAIRFSLSRDRTEEQIRIAAERIIEVVLRVGGVAK